jgi:hypothetical protein
LFSLFKALRYIEAFNSAIPPPGTIPSLIAALVAQIASSTLSFFSFNSISELAPTFTIAILADSLANLFSSFIILKDCFSVNNCSFKSAIIS